MNQAKINGTKAETAFVRYLRPNGFPYAERRALAGNKDLGDTTGHPGIVFEVKAEKDLSYPGALRETEAERDNAKASYGLLIHKPRSVGATRVGLWYAAMEHRALLALSIQAGTQDSVHLVPRSARGLDLKTALPSAQGTAGVILTTLSVIGGVLVETNQSLPNYVVVHVQDAITLLRLAGYGTPIQGEKDQ